MKLPIYHIDAFASELFEGNPAAVCPLDNWLPDELMQLIASENNLSETAFFVPNENGFHIRWFTPTSEVEVLSFALLDNQRKITMNDFFDLENIPVPMAHADTFVTRDKWIRYLINNTNLTKKNDCLYFYNVDNLVSYLTSKYLNN